MSGLLVGYCALQQERRDDAHAEFQRASELATSIGEPAYEIIADLHRAHFEPKALSGAIARTREAGPGGAPYVDVNLDVRLHARLHELHETASTSAAEGKYSEALVVDLQAGTSCPPEQWSQWTSAGALRCAGF